MRGVGITGNTLDRADTLRSDAAAYAAARASPNARLLVLESGDPLVTPGGDLRWLPLGDAAADAGLVLLGLDAGEPRFAQLADAPARRNRSPALLAALDLLRPDQAAILATARSLLDWHVNNGHCARCGAGTAVVRGGWGRLCDTCGAEHYPRVDPTVIMLVEHAERILIGRQASFPPGRYSALSGFVEPGETIEEAVAREVSEEVGIGVSNVRYVASQPWPFPSSLMIACMASAETQGLKLSPELEDAKWVSREEVRVAIDDHHGVFAAPPAYTIARTLMERWVRAQP